MNKTFYLFFILIVMIRIIVLFISKEHEKELLNEGGIEFGTNVSRSLAVLHTIIYFCALFEGINKQVKINIFSYIGILLLIFSFLILLIVIKTLGKYWTVKLIIAKSHTLNTSWIFKKIKHPNYFFNIIPELIGLILLFNAWWTLAIFVIPYGICLYLRIKEENGLLLSLKNREKS